MTVELIDGRAGKPHIGGDDLGNFKAGFVGIEGYVLETENKLAATLESANKLTINTGAAIMPTTGRHVRITSPETVTIQSGTQGQKRNDLVVLRTATSSDNTTVETASIVVIKGTPTTGTPTDPSINNGDLKLYRLSLDGISVENPVPLFNVLTPLATLGASVAQEVVDGWQILKIGSLAICRKAKQYTGLTPSRESGFANNSLSYGKVTITETLPYTLKDTATSVALAERDGFIAGSGNLDSGQKTNVRTNIFLANNTASSIWLNWIVYGTIV